MLINIKTKYNLNSHLKLMSDGFEVELASGVLLYFPTLGDVDRKLLREQFADLC